MEPIEAIKNFITVCTAITVFVAVINIIISLVSKAKAPNEAQDARIAALETRMEKAESKLDNDYERFEKYEQGNRIVQQSLLALMEHALDGNSVDKLREAKDDLQNYLIQK